MQTFYARIAEGSSHFHAGGGGFVGVGASIDTQAEDRVQAFLQIYRRLSEDYSDITALKAEGQRFMLGFTAEEWDEISKQPIRLRVSEVPDGEVQVQAIQDRPFI